MKSTILVFLIIAGIAFTARVHASELDHSSRKKPAPKASPSECNTVTSTASDVGAITAHVPEEERYNTAVSSKRSSEEDPTPITYSCNRGTPSNSVSDNKSKPVKPTTGGCENPPDTNSGYSGRGD